MKKLVFIIFFIFITSCYHYKRTPQGYEKVKTIFLISPQSESKNKQNDLLFNWTSISKAVEYSCMIKAVSPKKVTEGDWLYDDIVVAGKKIKSSWHGVSKSQLVLIKSKARGKILIKFGIPFTPSFLFGFVGLLILIWRYGGWF